MIITVNECNKEFLSSLVLECSAVDKLLNHINHMDVKSIGVPCDPNSPFLVKLKVMMPMPPRENIISDFIYIPHLDFCF